MIGLIDVVFMAIALAQLVFVIWIYRKVSQQQNQIETIIASTQLMQQRQNATYYEHLLSLRQAFIDKENYRQASVVDQAIKAQYNNTLEI